MKHLHTVSPVLFVQLIIMTPKSLLRHPDAKSGFDEMLEGTKFRRLIPDSGPAETNSENVRKLLFCTGKVYYDLAKDRTQKDKVKDIAIARVEQVWSIFGVQCAFVSYVVFYF